MKQDNKKSFKYLKYWIYIAAICIVLGGFGIYRMVKSDPEADNSTSQTTSTIRTGDIQISAFGSGTLISASEVEFGFENGGIVEEILVETGNQVTEGQLLARLEDEDLQEALIKVEQDLRELTSDVAIAAAALEIAEAQKAVLSAESKLSFFISPYVFKSEIRLREAELELKKALQSAALNPFEEDNKKVTDAQVAVDNATLGLALNWETYYDEYVPDFFNFRWRDIYGFWHDYYDPPSEIEVAVAWADLASAEARVEEAEIYLVVLTEGIIPENATGTQLTALENAGEAVSDALETLETSRLTAPISGVVINLEMQVLDKVNTTSIITIAQLEPPTVEALFDEGVWRLVKEGNPVEVIFDSLPEKTYSGRIVFVDPTLQTRQNTTSIRTLVELDTSSTGWADLPLLSAASVEVIAGEVQNAVLLPVEGLQDVTGSLGTVLILENDEVIEKEIELGLRDVLFVEVSDGLSVGDVVLIGSY